MMSVTVLCAEWVVGHVGFRRLQTSTVDIERLSLDLYSRGLEMMPEWATDK
jgi:hypothetical protein